MPTRRRRPETPNRAETLLSLVLLGLLAAVTAPNETASGAARDRATLETQSVELASSLAVLRNAVDAFAADHGSTRDRLDADARAALTAGRDALTPYLRRGRIPLNPVNGRRTLRVVDALPTQPGERAGWLLCTTDGEVRADVGGATPDGVPFFEL